MRVVKFNVGDIVDYKGLKCTVVESSDGLLKLRDDEGDEYDNVPCSVPRLPAAAAKAVDAREVPTQVRRLSSSDLGGLAEMKELTDFERRFVEECSLSFGDKTAAYLRAGGRAKTIEGARMQSWRTAVRPRVKAAIDAVMRVLNEEAACDRQRLFRQLHDLYQKATAAVPVLDKHGRPTGVWKVDYKEAVKITELQARLLGEFRDKVELTGKDGAPLKIEHTVGIEVATKDKLEKLTKEERLELWRLWKKMMDVEENKGVVVIQQPQALGDQVVTSIGEVGDARREGVGGGDGVGSEGPRVGA